MAQNNVGNKWVSGVEACEDTESDIIRGSMSASEILALLGRHGCNDVTRILDTSRVGRVPVSSGGFGNVYRGALRDGSPVGVKCLRLLIGIDDNEGKKLLKRAARELYVWSKCKHPNILELIGVAKYDGRAAMISPWMENGDLIWYLKQNPNANPYQLCVQISSACAFLKDRDVVHGDIKGANILVSKDHIPKLTDFGSSAVGKCTLAFTATTANPHMTLRWTAPEIFLGETKHTFAGDVYALGMTILEVFTRSAPYDDLLDVAVMRKLMEGAHPTRPEKHIPIGDKLSDRLWVLLTTCWTRNPLQRPSAQYIYACMVQLAPLSPPKPRRIELVDQPVCPERLVYDLAPVIEIPSTQNPSSEIMDIRGAVGYPIATKVRGKPGEGTVTRLQRWDENERLAMLARWAARDAQRSSDPTLFQTASGGSRA